MIQRACDDVYSSRASSAFASASTVERNVRSSPSKLEAFAIASLAWCASPPSRSSSRVAVLDLGSGRDGDRSPAALDDERGHDRGRLGEDERLDPLRERSRLDAVADDRTVFLRPRRGRRGRRSPGPAARVQRAARRQLRCALDNTLEQPFEALGRREVAPESSSAFALSASRRCAS